MSSSRVVLDTNVIISAALIAHSIPRLAVDKAMEQATILVSAATMGEINEGLRRPRFNRYVSEEERQLFIAILVNAVEVVAVMPARAVAIRKTISSLSWL
jgi:putative PIN family toxin of toxin-antitoxin system